ncbi:MAG: DUF3343 domain-containing protein [Clostridia bacterium]|nr:DUF3343 domain-containing protein [Clostridia bacterium]
MTVLAVFRSRSQAADCKARLAAAGISALLVSTPAELKTGCGLSVSISAYVYGTARAIIVRTGYSTFCGFAVAGQSGRYYLNR